MATIVPVPEADSAAPLPTIIVAEMFVPPVISVNEVDDPLPEILQSVLDCPELSVQVTPDPVKLMVGLAVKDTPSSATA